jgi:ferritin-like metal-binding protein YciE
MSQSEQKVVQYLNEAHATEVGLVRVLQSQIAMTPDGRQRALLEKHLEETRSHAERLRSRLGELGSARNPFLDSIGFVEAALGQTLALWKAPLDMLRGASAAEKVLKNAKDTCATESLEIATYTALEALAGTTGDATTAKLAASIRADEERMLDRVTRELPKLAQAVVDAEAGRAQADDVAASAVADVVRETERTAGRATAAGKRAVRQTRKVATRAKATGVTADDLPITRYDELNADEIVAKLPELSQVELAKVDAYERKHADRATIRTKLGALRGDEPWAGYDALTVDEIRSAIAEDGDETRVSAARNYERAHKNRAGVLEVVERELANA